MKRCARCGVEKPRTEYHRDRSRSDGLASRCKPCAAAHMAELKQRNGDRMKERRRARHRERMKTDPEYAERVRRQNRENRRKQRKANPEKNAEQVRNSYYRRRADPEAWAAFLAKKRAYWHSLKKTQPDRYNEILEARRIMWRLRRIEAGLPVRDAKKTDQKTPRLPVEPLRPLIEGWIKRYELDHKRRDDQKVGTGAIAVLAESAGINPRTLWRIRIESESTTLDVADKLCMALDVPLALVYDDQGEENDE